MIWTSKVVAASDATVRLMPSTATEPFSMKYGASVARKETGQPVELAVACQRLDPSGAVDVPLHEMPAEPASAASGRSRLTSDPGCSAPSAVTRKVSGETSAPLPRRSGVGRVIRRSAQRAPPSRAHLRHGEAHAVGRDAVAEVKLRGQRGLDSQALSALDSASSAIRRDWLQSVP